MAWLGSKINTQIINKKTDSSKIFLTESKKFKITIKKLNQTVLKKCYYKIKYGKYSYTSQNSNNSCWSDVVIFNNISLHDTNNLKIHFYACPNLRNGTIFTKRIGTITINKEYFEGIDFKLSNEQWFTVKSNIDLQVCLRMGFIKNKIKRISSGTLYAPEDTLVVREEINENKKNNNNYENKINKKSKNKFGNNVVSFLDNIVDLIKERFTNKNTNNCNCNNAKSVSNDEIFHSMPHHSDTNKKIHWNDNIIIINETEFDKAISTINSTLKKDNISKIENEYS